MQNGDISAPHGARARRWLINLGLSSITVVVSLLVGEFVSRLASPPQRGISWYHYDPRYQIRHRSNADAITNEWGDRGWWRFRTNGRGFRGSAWSDAPPQGVKRVLMVGDSMTFGNGVNEEDAFPRVANNILSASNPKWEVLNLGVSAWGPSNALGYLESEGSSIEARCLGYGFFLGNDVVDGLTSHLYELREGRLERAGEPGQPSGMALVRGAMRRFPAYDFLLAHSQLFNVLRKRMINVFARDSRDRTDLYVNMETTQFELGLDLNDAIMSRLAHVVRGRFGGFFVVLIPMHSQLVQAATSSPAEGLRGPFPRRIADRTRERMLRWCAAHHVPVLDLADSLPHDPLDADRLYFKRDFHFSVDGNRAVGEILARHLPELCAPGAGLRPAALP